MTHNHEAEVLRKLLEVLGLKDQPVKKLELRIAANEVVTLKVTRLVNADEIEGVTEWLEQFNLTKVEAE